MDVLAVYFGDGPAIPFVLAVMVVGTLFGLAAIFDRIRPERNAQVTLVLAVYSAAVMTFMVVRWISATQVIHHEIDEFELLVNLGPLVLPLATLLVLRRFRGIVFVFAALWTWLLMGHIQTTSWHDWLYVPHVQKMDAVTFIQFLLSFFVDVLSAISLLIWLPIKLFERNSTGSSQQ